MVIYYDSKTGNVERFISKVSSATGWHCIKISDSITVNRHVHLVTYTTKIGGIPDSTRLFMERCGQYIISVSSSGNRNWGPNFGLAADKISTKYTIPILIKFELSGLDRDIDTFIQAVKDYADKKMDTPQQ